ncbi:MAG: hypothetical protein N3F65_03185 [Nitrososphaeria archaeon]|nr:hypothetical protein [Aigarchaeota archaeon]MCX8187595.1 hypothetical protein [Nitrososphaeria archaeon]MDW8021271.1 hypothetical protein [Nitrososphaerota archaeon]
MSGREELYNLRGKTLQAYLYMIRKRDAIGVRELQRALGFSSPSVAHHHLEKLREMGLISRDEVGRYRVSEKVDVGVLKMFVIIGGKLVPRFLFYAVFFTSFLLLYIWQSFPMLDPNVLAIGCLASIFLWYEAIRLWRHELW